MTTPAAGSSAHSLAPCPRSPNCVSTRARGSQAIEPFRNVGTRDDAMKRLLSVLSSIPRTTIVAADSDRIQAEFRTRFFRFTDDAVFLYDEATGTIQFRSASRVGRSDFGVNRRRMEAIRVLMENR